MRMDGRDLHTIETDNVVRKENWLRAHPRDTVQCSQNSRWGFWWECHRDGRQVAEANDLGLLLNRLEADFDTPESREA